MKLIDKLKIKSFRKLDKEKLSDIDWDKLLVQLLDITEEEADKIELSEWTEMLSEIKSIRKEDYNFDKIKIGDDTFWFYPPNLFSLAEYLDVKTFLNTLNLNLFVMVFFRRKDESGKIIPWGQSLGELPLKFDELSIKYFYQCERLFFKFEEDIKRGFPMLFTEEENEQGEEDVVTDKRQQMQLRVERIKREQLKKEAWNNIIWGLCNNDITKWDQILRTPYLRILTVLKLEKIRE